MLLLLCTFLLLLLLHFASYFKFCYFIFSFVFFALLNDLFRFTLLLFRFASASASFTFAFANCWHVAVVFRNGSWNSSNQRGTGRDAFVLFYFCFVLLLLLLFVFANSRLTCCSCISRWRQQSKRDWKRCVRFVLLLFRFTSICFFYFSFC